MVIYKILNNNVVVIKDENDAEQIVMGRGIAFNKRAGDEFDETIIDKKFKLMDENINSKFQELLTNIPMEYVPVATKVIEYGKLKLGKKINDSIYISLSDHIASAIERKKNGVTVKNALYWEIKRFYPYEFQIGTEAVEIIALETGITLDEDEAGFIALHFVNAQLENEVPVINEITKVMKEIESIVSYTFKITLDEESVYYYRFITHLKFFAARLFTDKIYKDEQNDDLLEIIKIKYEKPYRCASKISEFILKKYGYILSDEEILYLTIHISKIVTESNLKKSK